MKYELGPMMKELLEPRFPLTREELGADAVLRKKGFVFESESYEAAGLGHLCILRMKAMLGLMKMETVVLSPTQKDLPLLNLDMVSVFGKTTQIVELYDTQLAPWPESAQAAFQALRDRDADIPEPASTDAHWYDSILYPCSYHKAAKGVDERLAAAARDYAQTFVDQAVSLLDCPAAEKQAKVRHFAETLFEKGGPAVNQVTKLFGSEVARRLIVNTMYGVKG